MSEFLAQYGVELGAISLGSVALIAWRILAFFKKDKYLLPFVNIAKVKANEVFGKENVLEFLSLAKTTKIKDVKVLADDVKRKYLAMDNKFNLYFRVLVATGALDKFPELKAEAEDIVKIT